MSEQTSAPATDAQTTTTATAPENVPAEAWDALGDPGKAALTAERTARTAAEQAAQALQAQLDQIARDSLSDLEKAQADARAAQEAAATAATEATRYRLAAKHGLSDEDAKFLVGDEENMTALAQRLAAANASTPRIPAPDPTQGAPGNGAPKSIGDKFAAAFDGRF